MWISVELFILKLSSKMCLIENILLKCYIFCYCSIKIFPVKFLISQNKAKFCVRVNQNVQQLRFYKRFPPHVTELWFINFPVRGTCKNVGLHQANFTVWGLKYGSYLCLSGWAYAAQQAWSCGATAKCVELECELVEWLAGVDRGWSFLVLCITMCQSCHTVYMCHSVHVYCECISVK
jgi:hypothetical protein